MGQPGTFTILRFGPHADLDVVHTEGLTSSLYIEDSDKVAVHRDAYQRISSAAEAVEASAELIRGFWSAFIADLETDVASPG
ncbi:Scr1 family TA system antitoxin-like transcriptional regulator [Streptomyces sp. NPDC014733]|uniref:Scr1 family TA system antitoxin-like transcriptional regulator n=1 Tax=Streptomyces sp. NPDC014733 TaxID=3364885 RepID=UPI0036F902D2